MKRKPIMPIIGLLVGFMIAVAGFSTHLSRTFYQHHPRSLQDVEKDWGEPVLIEKDDNGLEKWVYELKIPVDAGFSFRYFVIDDGNVVSSGVRDTLEIAAK